MRADIIAGEAQRGFESDVEHEGQRAPMDQGGEWWKLGFVMFVMW
jgi:hypothetical protein